jgi:hypothetical protein
MIYSEKEEIMVFFLVKLETAMGIVVLGGRSSV